MTRPNLPHRHPNSTPRRPLPGRGSLFELWGPKTLEQGMLRKQVPAYTQNAMPTLGLPKALERTVIITWEEPQGTTDVADKLVYFLVDTGAT